MNNLNDGLAWGLLPLFFAAGGLGIAQIGLLAGIYPGVWGTAQLLTGALSDRLGRKGLIVAGMMLQGVSMAVGVYRLWRDSGYAIGALLAGVLADLFGVPWAIGVIGVLTFLSGVLVKIVMSETLRSQSLPQIMRP